MRRSHPLPLRLDLPLEIWALSPGHLGLSGYAHRYAVKFETIGDLLAACNGYSRRLPPHADRARQEIRATLTELNAAIGTRVIRWDDFRDSREKSYQGHSIYFFSPSLTATQNSICQNRLGQLHLTARAINALERIEVRTIAELIAAAKRGIEHIAESGALTSTEIIDSLHALSKCADRKGNINWIQYARKRDFVVLPRPPRARWTPASCAHALPSVAREVVKLRYGAAHVSVLKARLLRPLHRQISLVELGLRLNLSSQQLQLIEHEIIALFRGIVFEDDYRSCKFRVRPAFLAPIRNLAAYFAKQQNAVLSVAQWEEDLTKVWRMPAARIQGVERLILEILGFGNLGLRNYAPSISRKAVLEMRMRLRRAAESIS